MNYPDIPWRKEHNALRRKLEKFRWSVDELRWLQAHSTEFPESIKLLIDAKIRKAEKEAHAHTDA